MNDSTLTCQNEQRRHRVRDMGLNGLDYLEVSDDQLRLAVYFLGKAPEEIEKENVRITGGRRFRDIRVVDLRMCYQDDPERDDCMIVTVDKLGDFSTYTLCLVDLDADGRPTDLPFPRMDPRYVCLEFSFKAGCPSDLDCKQQEICPPPEYTEPEINYLAKDYASFRQLILDRLALIMPDWQERHVPDMGVALVELLAYVGDHLSYYQDAVATEAYLDTARQRISVRRHARLVDYHMHEGCNARAWVCVATDTDDMPLQPDTISFITGANDTLPFSRSVLTWDDLRNIPPGQYEVFEPLVEKPEEPVHLYSAHNEIQFYTWGDRECCLPRGATAATLRDKWVPILAQESDAQEEVPYEQTAQQQEPPKGPPPEPSEPERRLHLKAGDVLIFEEIIGPKTGDQADADPTRRHAVRLTRAELGEDSLYNQPEDSAYNQPIVEIEWAEEDALPFPLCISAIGPAPQCELLEDISVARGNVILVDHGRRIDEDEGLGTVPAEPTAPVCEGEGRPAEVETLPARFRPVLKNAPLTFSQPLPANSPASGLLTQNPRQALPCIDLRSIPPVPGDIVPLFRLDDLKDPTSLAVRLWDTKDFASEYLRGLLSSETAQLLNDYGGTGQLSDALEKALVDELNELLKNWNAERDLLGSHQDDLHFVVEVDNERRAYLRFGDGELGRMPEAGSVFLATYRVGNGPAGNVGTEAISHIVFRKTSLSGVTLQPRNPLPAKGGTDPEPLAEVKMFAPYAFCTELQRAITADDYAELVMRDFKDKVQRAAATLRWTGSWYEVLVAIDPVGQVEARQDLLDEIAGHLYRYRRIGHDVAVKPAYYVPLDIEMTVCVLPDYLRGHVKAVLLDLFSNRMLTGGQRGFFHPDNLTFGEGIFLSKLVAAAHAVPGVESVTVTKLERLYEGPNQEIENGILPLGPLEIARLDNDPSFPENGQLRIIMGGGR